jgi:gamma-glutamyltranspeptidase / glutathione hydrolase
VRVVKCTLLISVLFGGAPFAGVADEQTRPSHDPLPAALAEGRNGVVVGTTGPSAVRAGLEILKKGGSAADAAMATALAQVVECGGCYVSHAGILSMVYYEADTGKVHYLNAGFNIPREERDPLTIPGGGKPSGRSALVPGFMAGVQAAHDRFGRLSRQEVFAPAIAFAEQGITVSPLLARLLQGRKSTLGRLPETRRIFTKEGGDFYAEGDLFRQRELASTLRHVADEGAGFMYRGAWADQFVAAVQKEGGKLTLEDMKSYRAAWEEPLQATYRGHKVYAPAFSSTGGVALVEALNLLERADLPRQGHYATTPASLFWLMQISHCQVLSFLPAKILKDFEGLDLSLPARVKKETAAGIWERMQDGKWPFAAKLRVAGHLPANHSDGVAVADRWGNVAALTHSINTSSWGDTALFVGGISIPDAAAIQQFALAEAGAGNRLPDCMCPLIVCRDGKPLLASSAIGGGLHPKTLQVLSSVLDFGMEPQTAVEQPAFLLAAFSDGPPVARVGQGKFDGKLLAAVRALGQQIREVSAQEATHHCGYWVGVEIAPNTNLRRGIGTRQAPLPSVSEGY